jgi:thiol-disulfide isomerase/thioredoxin
VLEPARKFAPDPARGNKKREARMRKTLVSLIALILPCVFFLHATALAADKTGQQKLAPGDIPPPALGMTRNGDEIETTQFTGRVMVVTFWASWCGPCRQELVMLDGLQKVAKERVKVVAVNIEDRDKFRALSRALSGLSVTLTSDPGKRYADAYGVNGIPHMVIIGKDGKVINVHRGYSEAALDGLVDEINVALAKG